MGFCELECGDVTTAASKNLDSKGLEPERKAFVSLPAIGALFFVCSSGCEWLSVMV